MRRAAGGSETALVHGCLSYLLFQGCYVWRNNTGAMTIRQPARRTRFVRFGQPGASDILGCGPRGEVVAVECKRGQNQPTALQTAFLAQIQARGGFGAVAWDVEQLRHIWEAYCAQRGWSSRPTG